MEAHAWSRSEDRVERILSILWKMLVHLFALEADSLRTHCTVSTNTHFSSRALNTRYTSCVYSAATRDKYFTLLAAVDLECVKGDV